MSAPKKSWAEEQAEENARLDQLLAEQRARREARKKTAPATSFQQRALSKNAQESARLQAALSGFCAPTTGVSINKAALATQAPARTDEFVFSEHCFMPANHTCQHKTVVRHYALDGRPVVTAKQYFWRALDERGRQRLHPDGSPDLEYPEPAGLGQIYVQPTPAELAAHTKALREEPFPHRLERIENARQMRDTCMSLAAAGLAQTEEIKAEAAFAAWLGEAVSAAESERNAAWIAAWAKLPATTEPDLKKMTVAQLKSRYGLHHMHGATKGHLIDVVVRQMTRDLLEPEPGPNAVQLDDVAARWGLSEEPARGYSKAEMVQLFNPLLGEGSYSGRSKAAMVTEIATKLWQAERRVGPAPPVPPEALDARPTYARGV